jgi:hypothetical protein
LLVIGSAPVQVVFLRTLSCAPGGDGSKKRVAQKIHAWEKLEPEARGARFVKKKASTQRRLAKGTFTRERWGAEAQREGMNIHGARLRERKLVSGRCRRR